MIISCSDIILSRYSSVALSFVSRYRSVAISFGYPMVPCSLKRKVKNFLLELQKTGCLNTWEPSSFNVS